MKMRVNACTKRKKDTNINVEFGLESTIKKIPMGSTKIPPCCLFSIMLDDVASLVHATLHPFYLHIFSGRNPKQSYGAK